MSDDVDIALIVQMNEPCNPSTDGWNHESIIGQLTEPSRSEVLRTEYIDTGMHVHNLHDSLYDTTRQGQALHLSQVQRLLKGQCPTKPIIALFQ